MGPAALTPQFVPADDLASLVPPAPKPFFERTMIFWTTPLLGGQSALRRLGVRYDIALRTPA